MRSAVLMRWLIVVLVALCFGPAHAGGRLPNLRYRGGAQGRVIFDHQLHAADGCRCGD
jgi:hypothetical protein